MKYIHTLNLLLNSALLTRVTKYKSISANVCSRQRISYDFSTCTDSLKIPLIRSVCTTLNTCEIWGTICVNPEGNYVWLTIIVLDFYAASQTIVVLPSMFTYMQFAQLEKCI